jgi:hypothetical protein
MDSQLWFLGRDWQNNLRRSKPACRGNDGQTLFSRSSASKAGAINSFVMPIWPTSGAPSGNPSEAWCRPAAIVPVLSPDGRFTNVNTGRLAAIAHSPADE